MCLCKCMCMCVTACVCGCMCVYVHEPPWVSRLRKHSGGSRQAAAARSHAASSAPVVITVSTSPDSDILAACDFSAATGIPVDVTTYFMYILCQVKKYGMRVIKKKNRKTLKCFK